MNNIQCDECGAGYRPGMLADCTKCKGEYCDTCHRDHACSPWDVWNVATHKEKQIRGAGKNGNCVASVPR